MSKQGVCQAKKKVGIQPHVIYFNKKIRFEGEKISREVFAGLQELSYGLLSYKGINHTLVNDINKFIERALN